MTNLSAIQKRVETINPHWVGNEPGWDVKIENITIKDVTRAIIQRHLPERSRYLYEQVVTEGSIQEFAKAELVVEMPTDRQPMSNPPMDSIEEVGKDADEIKRLVVSILDECGQLIDLVARQHPMGYKSMPFHNRSRKHLREFAQQRHAEGYSIRQIMRLMNYKSPHSIQELLREK